VKLSGQIINLSRVHIVGSLIIEFPDRKSYAINEKKAAPESLDHQIRYL
jgi:hypothetical protein